MSSIEKLLEFRFPAKAESLGLLRKNLREILKAHSKSDETINCVVLAVSEACINIMEHAYRHDDNGDIIVEIEKQSDSITFRLTDFSLRKTCIEEMKSRPLDEIRPGGLGCHIINEIMDEIKLLDNGNTSGNILQLKKNINN